MVATINLAEIIERSLPVELVGLIKKAEGLAEDANREIYLVGGLVRDLLLDQPNLDIDLVVNSDAIKLAEQLAEETGGKLKVHPMFNTANIKLEKWSIDVAMLRAETYARPGALPAVRPGTLKEDLFRRDFTINAMAVRLNATRYGELIDMFGGRDDLNHKIIRVLHEKSFIDDATRIWRAIRYEQRLGFQIEPKTQELLKRDLAMLATVGGYRIRRELELVLREKAPEKSLVRADELGVLPKVNPALKADRWLTERFQRVKGKRFPHNTLPGLYLALLTYRLDNGQLAALTRYLRFLAEQTTVIDETRELARQITELLNRRPGETGSVTSNIQAVISRYSKTAVWANLVIGVPRPLRQIIEQSVRNAD